MKYYRLFMISLLWLNLFTGIANSQTAKFVYDAKDKRDPFIPYISKDGKILALPGVLGEVVLEGISQIQKGDSVCVIDGVVFREGETCGNFKIIKIKIDSIIVSCNNKEYEIELKEEGGEENKKEDNDQTNPDTGNF